MRAIIFDFDGTILDTDHAIYLSWQAVYDHYGIEFPFDLFLTRIGRVEENFDVLAYLIQQLNNDTDAKQVVTMQQELVVNELKKLPARDGVLAWINDAKQQGIKLAIASNSSLNWILQHLKQLNLFDYFDAIACRDNVKDLKPSPDVYHCALKQLNTHETETIAIEDSPSGVAAAHAAGLQCVIIPSAMTSTMQFPDAIYRATSLAHISLNNFLDRVKESLACRNNPVELRKP